MTENECVETLQYLLGYENAVDKGELDLPNYLNSEEKEALKFILAKIQQYRAIGTIEYFKLLKGHYRTLNEMCKEYSAIGTIEEFKALKEKNTAKKISGKRFEEAICPRCESELFETYWAFGGIHYCSNCGQAIDWQ